MFNIKEAICLQKHVEYPSFVTKINSIDPTFLNLSMRHFIFKKNYMLHYVINTTMTEKCLVFTQTKIAVINNQQKKNEIKHKVIMQIGI